MGVRLGGFVIHGNDSATLGACVESLQAVCDVVVAHNSQPWRGFGAARAEAVARLGPCDYVFFLDSDEWLEPPALAALRGWKQAEPTHAFYKLLRNDWLMLDGRVLYRQEHKRRLIRRDVARWSDAMIIHESLPPGDTGSLAAEVEHAFVTSLQALGSKTREYALLWALQQKLRGRAPSAMPAPLLRAAHLVRDGLIKGAFFRGGGDAVRVASSVADYHVWKYRFLRAIGHGRFAEELDLLARGELAAVMSRVRVSAALGLSA